MNECDATLFFVIRYFSDIATRHRDVRGAPACFIDVMVQAESEIRTHEQRLLVHLRDATPILAYVAKLSYNGGLKTTDSRPDDPVTR